MRVALNEHVVLEGGRLGLVPVDHQVGQRVLAQHRPLAPGREAGAAPAQQAGRVDLGRHRLGRHGQRLAQPGVATGGQVALQREGVVVAETGRDDLRGVGDGHQAFFSAPAAVAAAARAACSWATVARSVLMAVRSACRPTRAAHPDQRAVARHGVGQTTGPEVVDQGVEAGRRLRPHVAVVDLHARRLVAVGQALRLVQGEHAVGRRPAGADTEGRLGVLEQLERAAEQAGDVGAHRHGVGADGLGVQHVVEARGAPAPRPPSRHRARRFRSRPRGPASRPAPGPGGTAG